MSRPLASERGAVRTLSAGDFIFQNADAVYFDFDDIARLHRAGRAWRAGVDYVPAFQRHILAGEADDRWRVEKQITEQLRLLHFPVDPRLQPRFLIVESDSDRRAERPEGV